MQAIKQKQQSKVRINYYKKEIEEEIVEDSNSNVILSGMDFWKEEVENESLLSCIDNIPKNGLKVTEEYLNDMTFSRAK